jgi:hypothetical protein
VHEAPPGSLVIFAHSGTGTWRACLAVADQAEGRTDKLLALEFDEGNRVRPFLLGAVVGKDCVVLGKAEFAMSLEDLSASSADLGYIVLGATGPAIVGERPLPQSLIERCGWLITTGRPVTIDAAAPCAAKWEVGIIGAEGKFERLLSFPRK